ncbi:MAG: Tetratricopeptide 4 [Rhizorhabdus sp.]|nr:Tetratricopeptide 4 [Rhizorhabdus sp.]
MRAIGLLLQLGVGIAALAAPAMAQVPDAAPKVQPKPPSEDELKRAIDVAQKAVAQQDCRGVLGALDPLVPRLGDTPQRAAIQRLRLVCLGVENRVTEIAGVQRELGRSMPKDKMVQAFGVLVAADENRFVDAANQIASLAAQSPQSLEILTGTAIRGIAARLTEQRQYAARGEMLVALSQADWQPNDMPELRASFAQGAIDVLVGSGKTEEAAELLDRVDQPEVLTGMAIERHYAPLWPALEKKLGPASGSGVDRFARDRLAFYSDNPQSEPALRDAANALLLLGRHQDVIDLTSDLAVQDGMSSDAVRVAQYRARALAALGRNDEVVQLYDRFQSLDLRRTPDASTVLISYAEFLDEIGHEQQALDTAQRALASASGLLTNFGKRWLDRTEICALSALGRVAEANASADRLKAVAAQNESAAIEALLCARRDAEAAQIAVKAFEDKDMAGNLIIQFQPGEAVLGSTPSRLRQLWIAFLARPDIKAAFDRRGRILPRTLWPSAEPRAIPHSGGGSSLT